MMNGINQANDSSTNIKAVISLLNSWTPIEKAPEEGPSEIFDKHPITAMQQQEPSVDKNVKYLRVSDSWRTEWHKDGVQVLVKSAEERKVPHVRIRRSVFKRKNLSTSTISFKMPKSYITKVKVSHGGTKRHRSLPIRYQLDRLDYAWLETENEERGCMGMEVMQDWQLERIIDLLERLCYKKMRRQLREVETRALEFDEDAKCDVCQSKEGEEGNELVFCEECFLCVHQACYGIEELPMGSWLCARCTCKAKPTTACVLCPNTGGAMKLTNNHRWCHVSCALWIPEVSFGNVLTMEPIINIEKISCARQRLRCYLCRVRQGACVQCGYGRCKVAFHYTCAVQAGLFTNQQLTNNMNDVHFVAFCGKHSPREQQQQLQQDDSTTSQTDPTITTTIKNKSPSKFISAEDVRRQKLAELEASFHATLQSEDLHWALQSLQPPVSISKDIQAAVTTYWRLKRRSQHNRACLPGSSACDDLLSLDPDVVLDASEQLQAFTQLRFSLDRARLMLDMVKRREKLKLTLLNNIMSVSEQQLESLLIWNENEPVPSWLANCHQFISTAFLERTVSSLPSSSTTLTNGQSCNGVESVGESASSKLRQISKSQLIVSREIALRVRNSLRGLTHMRHLFRFRSPMEEAEEEERVRGLVVADAAAGGGEEEEEEKFKEKRFKMSGDLPQFPSASTTITTIGEEKKEKKKISGTITTTVSQPPTPTAAATVDRVDNLFERFPQFWRKRESHLQY